MAIKPLLIMQAIGSACAALLVCAPIPARAEWVKVAETEQADQYFDRDTIELNGDLRKAWRLLDLRAPRLDGKRSLRLLSEYDCKGERMRFLLGFAYAGQMGTGDRALFGSGAVSDWDHPPTGSVGAAILEQVCSYKPDPPTG